MRQMTRTAGHAMTMRERMLAVIQGREHDRVPFAMYEIMLPAQEAFDLLGHGNIGLIRFCSIFRAKTPNCRRESEIFFDEGTKWERTVLHTPKGDLTELRIFEPAFDSSTARKHFVETREDYERLWSYLEDAVILENYDQYYRDCAELGDDGIPKTEIERTPWQQLWIEWVGLEPLSYHLVDWPEHVEHTLELLERRARQTFEIAARSPAPFIVMVDNITASAIGPARFRRYCARLYDELDAMLAERGIPVFSHMDGMLKPLWKDIARSRVAGLDSFTPTPDCDTTVAEAVAMWPEKRLWLNFPSSVHLAPPEQIQATADQILADAGHTGRLQIQISENVPLDRWQISFPIIAEAIEAFGKP
jgi:hypothetical protein